MIFWIENNNKITYDELIFELKQGKSSNLLKGYNYVYNLLLNLSKECDFENLSDLQDCLLKNSSKQSFVIETSGTTSDPKKINISLKNCIRQVKINKSVEKKIWGNCYPFQSYAFTQVLFQSFFNRETIVYCFSKDFKNINNILFNEKITNLTCTPTFLNMLIINYEKENQFLKTITTGGEKLNDKILNSYQSAFPNARYINIYASSEAGSLLYSNSNIFKIPAKLKNQVKIENNELLIHKSLINDSNENNIVNDWLHTGDEVGMIDQESFLFNSRKTSYINTGGYRVNPIEIEDVISSIEGIDDVRVFGKSNSILGTIICAEVITSLLNIKEIKISLKDKIEDYKIPQVIQVVKQLTLTHSGKKSRKS